MRRADCTVYYDTRQNRLVYIGRTADQEYWDEHWAINAGPTAVRRRNVFVSRVTRKWLPSGARVIDAGCGLAHTVYTLHSDGYEAYGVDFAAHTVAAVNRLAPELRVTVADVRKMDQFPDHYFDGCWSVGVIEHFYEGYRAVVHEMRRVLRPGGVAFVTVPSLSPIRRLKRRLGAYPEFSGNPQAFYQFALDPKTVIREFGTHGFSLLSTGFRGGLKGLKDECPSVISVPIQRLYDAKTRPLRLLRHGLDQALKPLTYHTRLFVFRAT